MTVSKRLRYEVLRRDGYTCRYCGASAPDVALTIDHVVPVVLGGLDEPANLVTACCDCNAGKTSSAPDQSLVADVSSDAARWAAAMQAAAEEMSGSDGTRNAVYRAVEEEWLTGWQPSNWTSSIDQLIDAGLPLDTIIQMARVAQSAYGVSNRWKYFCGCCWKRVQQLRDRATEIANAGADAQPEVDPWQAEVDAYISEVFTSGIVDRALPNDPDERESVVVERFEICPVHDRTDCPDDRCVTLARIAGCAWALDQVEREIRESRSRERRRKDMKTAYRAGFEDARTGGLR